MIIKVNWEAHSEGEEYIDLEDIGITLEEWEEMTEEDKKETLQSFINEVDNVVAYGYVSDYSVMEE